MRIAPSMNHKWHLQCITDCTRPAIQKSYWSYKEQCTLIHTPLPLPPSNLLQNVMHCAGHCAVASLLCPRIHIDAMSISSPHRCSHVRRREVLHEPLSINTLLEGAMRHGLGQGACHPNLFWAQEFLGTVSRLDFDFASSHDVSLAFCATSCRRCGKVSRFHGSLMFRVVVPWFHDPCPPLHRCCHL